MNEAAMIDNIDTMTAGQALDTLIHELVMGKVWDVLRCRICGWSLYKTTVKGCTADSCGQRPPPRVRADEPPSYSTDIQTAWTVVEKLGRHVVVTVEQCGRRERGDWGYRCGIANAGNTQMIYEYAGTAPLAVCRAALKVME